MVEPTEEEVRAFQARLASPFLPIPNEEFSKTRMRLLTVGSFCLAVGVFGLELAREPVVLSVAVRNLTDGVFKFCLFAIDAYLLVHFVWLATDAFSEWRLRLTGHEDLPLTSIGAVGAPYLPGRQNWQPDVRQATLYSFWVQQARFIGNPAASARKLEELIESFRTGGKSAPELNELVQAASKLSHEASRVDAILSSVQVPATLQRFDRWFAFTRASQNIRWLLFDLFFPFLVGTAGLMLVSKAWWMSLLHVALK